MKTLETIFNEHKTDKGHKHKYHLIYDELWKNHRNDDINFLEVGIWKGAGMSALREYFPNGHIYGIDIFTRLQPSDVPVLNESRIHWEEGNSMDIGITGVLEDSFDVKFDYILDDGAHYPEANKLTFRHLHPLLKKGGLYIIEDVWPIERMKSEELMHPWLRKNQTKYNFMKNSEFLHELENSGMKITRYDNRSKSGEPDSYVIVLEKTS